MNNISDNTETVAGVAVGHKNSAAKVTEFLEAESPAVSPMKKEVERGSTMAMFNP